eukprot:gene16845-biopygen21831
MLLWMHLWSGAESVPSLQRMLSQGALDTVLFAGDLRETAQDASGTHSFLQKKSVFDSPGARPAPSCWTRQLPSLFLWRTRTVLGRGGTPSPASVSRCGPLSRLRTSNARKISPRSRTKAHVVRGTAQGWVGGQGSSWVYGYKLKVRDSIHSATTQPYLSPQVSPLESAAVTAAREGSGVDCSSHMQPCQRQPGARLVGSDGKA